MPIEIIETEKYRMKIHPEFNYMEYIIKPGVAMDVEDVVTSREQAVKLFPGVNFYVFSEGAEFFTLTKKARELCATKEHLDNTIAIAFYTANTTVYFMGEIFSKINKPAVPTKIFTSREVAKEWLREQARLNGHKVGF